MKKGTFILYDVDLESADYLSDSQVARLFRAIIKYRLDGTSPDFSDDAALKIIFHQISQHIALNEEKYQETCAKRSEAIKKRWNKEKNNTNEYKSIEMNTNGYIYDTETVNDTETDTGTVTDNENYTVTVNDTYTDTDACGAKRENKRKNYYSKKKDVPALPRDEPSYDIDAFTRKAIGLKYKKPEA